MPAMQFMLFIFLMCLLIQCHICLFCVVRASSYEAQLHAEDCTRGFLNSDHIDVTRI